MIALIKYQFKIMKANKIDTLLVLLNFVVFQIIQLIFILLMFGKESDFYGWNYLDMLFMNAFFITTFYGEKFFTLGLTSFEQNVNRGLFDKNLITPIPISIQLMFSKMNLSFLFQSIIGLGALIYFGSTLGLFQNLENIAFVLLMILSVIIIRISLKFLLASLVFYTHTSFIFQVTIDSISEYSKYPIQIFPPFFRIIFMTILPISFLCFVPVSIILEKQNSASMIISLIIVGMIIVISGFFLFSIGMKRYQSTGN